MQLSYEIVNCVCLVFVSVICLLFHYFKSITLHNFNTCKLLKLSKDNMVKHALMKLGLCYINVTKHTVDAHYFLFITMDAIHFTIKHKAFLLLNTMLYTVSLLTNFYLSFPHA